MLLSWHFRKIQDKTPMSKLEIALSSLQVQGQNISTDFKELLICDSQGAEVARLIATDNPKVFTLKAHYSTKALPCRKRNI